MGFDPRPLEHDGVCAVQGAGVFSPLVPSQFARVTEDLPTALAGTIGHCNNCTRCRAPNYPACGAGTGPERGVAGATEAHAPVSARRVTHCGGNSTARYPLCGAGTGRGRHCGGLRGRHPRRVTFVGVRGGGGGPSTFFSDGSAMSVCLTGDPSTFFPERRAMSENRPGARRRRRDRYSGGRTQRKIGPRQRAGMVSCHQRRTDETHQLDSRQQRPTTANRERWTAPDEASSDEAPSSCGRAGTDRSTSHTQRR
jgi:hypothetical protein